MGTAKVKLACPTLLPAVQTLGVFSICGGFLWLWQYSGAPSKLRSTVLSSGAPIELRGPSNLISEARFWLRGTFPTHGNLNIQFWTARNWTSLPFSFLFSGHLNKNHSGQTWVLVCGLQPARKPCGLQPADHPLRPGSHQSIRCPNSQSDPGKLQPILPKPFEKKQIPSSSDINERDRRWPEDHRDAGPSDREVQFLVPKSTVQSETLESDVEERRSVSFFLVQTKHPRLRGTEKTRCPWFSKFWEILSRRAPELETVLLS